ncbi:MAG TPA: EAL domain-containing protein [Pyrinomonadaceae bacterium]|jgi:diguanylate cyclase (GGDEF)-like protein|nr:EAL domain-containing protein [Pyrinomonadaceae bacterium]
MLATETKRPGLLIIDDDQQIRSLLYSVLADEYDCTMVNSAEAALGILKTIKFDVVISDINMGGISGLDLVPLVLQQAPETVVVMVSGQHRIDAAIQAMRAGAFDYLTKPFDLQHVEAAMQRALAHHRLLEEKKYYEDSLKELLSSRTAEVERLAYFDSLTDLPNRLLFEDRLTQALKHAQKDNQPVGNVLMRIDRFKEITDTLGPATGSRLLREIAWRVRKSSDERGTVARFEGDNFALLITDIHGSEDVLEVLKHLMESVRVPFVLDDHRLHVTASIGVSLFPIDGETSEELLKNAGIALFRAESVGGDNYQFYQAEMNARALELLKMEGDLRRAIEDDELRLYYQPQVDLRTHQIVGVEALVRWQHPELGMLQPSRFIPLAEDTGLVVPLGEWGLREACRQLVMWQQNGLDGLRISVNVSPAQFQQGNFVETVAQILRKSEIDPAKLQFEITETSLMNNADDVLTRLTELKQMGLMIAIDDFGVGYSSLGYLKRLPIDMLKIDRSFVNDATTDPDDAALIMAIITLAHNLRLKVMAEGVETNDQVRFLSLLRCDEAQGYLFGKAEPGEFFTTKTIGATGNATLPGSRQSTINQERERFRVLK